jgi:hypothetical protein
MVQGICFGIVVLEISKFGFVALIQLTGGQQTPASCSDKAVRDRASGTRGWRNGP